MRWVQSDEDKNSMAGASELDEAIVDNTNTDYRRGKRFKKLARVLSSQMVQRQMARFKMHTIMVVSGLTIAHVGVFILVYVLLRQQKAGVTDLNTAGGHGWVLGWARLGLQQLLEHSLNYAPCYQVNKVHRDAAE